VFYIFYNTGRWTKSKNPVILKNITLPVVLYACETCSLKLREEHGLKKFENRVLKENIWTEERRNGGWRTLHNEELHNLYPFAGFPQRRPGFEPRSGHVEFVVDKVAQGQVFSEYFGFPCQFSFHRMLYIHHPGLVQ
jgi:hypothetical protein